MTIQDYLQWFEDNYRLMARFFDGSLGFSLHFGEFTDGARWIVGYSYDDYDGTLFPKYIRGDGVRVLDALNVSYQRTVPVVEKLRLIEQELRSLEHFEQGERYTVIKLSASGNVVLTEVTGTQEARRGGLLFRYERGEVLYRPYQYRFIFPELSPEMSLRLK